MKIFSRQQLKGSRKIVSHFDYSSFVKYEKLLSQFLIIKQQTSTGARNFVALQMLHFELRDIFANFWKEKNLEKSFPSFEEFGRWILIKKFEMK